MIDVSLVLNLHRESRFVLRTLMSLKDAVDYARLYGIVTELVVVLDRPDGLTRDVLKKFNLCVFDYAEVIEIDRGSLGLARNDGIDRARGKYVRLCDGDDLISFNLISTMYQEATVLGPRAVLLAEWLFAFGERRHCVQYRDLDFVTPLAMIDIHPYVSQIFFARSLFDDLQFEDLRLSAGYAYEDWHFATEAVALGYTFRVARDTAFFYRQRKGSLLNLANDISVRQISPSRLFIPSVYLRVCAESYGKYINGQVTRESGDARAYIDSALGRHHFFAANLIEPAIDPLLIRESDQYFVSQASNLNIGRRYFEICQRLGDATYTDIFILPFFGPGGGEKYIANVILTLCELNRDSSILVLLGERHDNNVWLTKFPSSVKSVDLSVFADEIGESGIDIITLKLIQALGSGARLHFRASDYGERFFASFGRVLHRQKIIFYRFGQGRRVDSDVSFYEPWVFQFLSEHIEIINAVICDNEKVIEYDQRRIGITPEKWVMLPTLYDPPAGRQKARREAAPPSMRVLWASRLCRQKRPAVLLALARKAQRIHPELMFHIYGVQSEDFDVSAFDAFTNVSYHGGYNSFESIVSDDYCCFIYTSACDGIPNVLLEAAGHELPIIAPNVGAVSEVIESDVTGILLPDIPEEEEMADAYVEAIAKLKSHAGFGKRLAENALERVISKFGVAAYRTALSRILEERLG